MTLSAHPLRHMLSNLQTSILSLFDRQYVPDQVLSFNHAALGAAPAAVPAAPAASADVPAANGQPNSILAAWLNLFAVLC